MLPVCRQTKRFDAAGGSATARRRFSSERQRTKSHSRDKQPTAGVEAQNTSNPDEEVKSVTGDSKLQQAKSTSVKPAVSCQHHLERKSYMMEN